jgi:DNA-binding NarL/FixJ family response regulator
VIRVLLADDQTLVRTGFRAILGAERDIEVVGEASDGREAIEQAALRRVDVVLMDIQMPGTDGIEATRRIVGTGPRVLILTTFDVDELVYAALRAGASGFLLKDAPADQLLAAIRIVAKGDALIDPVITRRLIADFAQRPPHRERPAELAELTDREVEVLRLIARGLSNAEIAQTLFVGEATVKTHVGRVLQKLDLRDRVQAVVFAYECGLVAAGSG